MKEYIETPKISEILREDFMEPLDLSAYKVAKDMGISVSNIQDLLNDKRRVSPKMSIRLGEYFGVSDDYFLNLQNDIDIRNEKLSKLNSIHNGTINNDKVELTYNNDVYPVIEKEIDVDSSEYYKEFVLEQYDEATNNKIGIKNSIESVKEIRTFFSIDICYNDKEKFIMICENLVDWNETKDFQFSSDTKVSSKVLDSILMSA